MVAVPLWNPKNLTLYSCQRQREMKQFFFLSFFVFHPAACGVRLRRLSISGKGGPSSLPLTDRPVGASPRGRTVS